MHLSHLTLITIWMGARQEKVCVSCPLENHQTDCDGHFSQLMICDGSLPCNLNAPLGFAPQASSWQVPDVSHDLISWLLHLYLWFPFQHCCICLSLC